VTASRNPLLLLGQIAVHEGHLTPEQLDACLKLQETSDPPRRLGAILLERGFVTAEQIDGLMEIQRRRLQTIAADPDRGGLFGQIALKLSHVTQLQLDECLREQQALSRDGSPVLLGQILLKKGYLTTEQFLEILRRQKREVVRCPGCETIYDSKDQPEGAKFVCTRCGTVVQVPWRETEAVSPKDPRPIPVGRTEPDYKGEAIGRYLILEKIGQGGMGVVYKALHRDLNRVFALKVLRAGEMTTFETVRRFQREARLAAKLRHPNIVAVHDAGEEQGIHYIAMEYIEGEPLSARLIARRGRTRDNLLLMEKVLRAVAYAHAQGVIHRDLKPGNVMVDKAGEPHIMDFGLAKGSREEGSLLTRSGAFLGTPFYMAPEQIEGDRPVVDAQTDVYALGVMLYEILSGRLPHVGANSAETFVKITRRDPVPLRQINARIHPDLETLCMKAMEKDRRLRYPGADVLAEELRRHLDGEPILSRAPGLLERAVRWVRKNPARAVAGAALACAAATGAALFAGVHRRDLQFRSLLTEARRADRDGLAEEARSAAERALALQADPEAQDLLARARLRLLERESAETARRLRDERRAAARPRIDEGRGRLERLAVRIPAEGLAPDAVAADAARAEHAFEEALALAPDHEEALLGLARCRLLRGDAEGALRHLDAACRAEGHLDAVHERGRLLLRLCRRPRGLPVLLVRDDRPVFADPAPDSPAAEAFRRRAKADFLWIRARAEERSAAQFSEAALEFLELRFEAAERKAAAYLESFPGDPDGLALRALARIHLGRPAEAGRDLDAALRLRPGDAFLLDWRAVALWLRGDAEGAEAGLRRPSAGPDTLVLRGGLRHARGDAAGAYADFEAAVQAAPRSAEARAGRGLAQLALKRAAEAESDLLAAIELDPGEAAFHEALGLLRLRSGRRGEALTSLERAVELSPSRRARLQEALEEARKP
jgi:Flp pilus assembly protein TadD/predicted Ser/Thr protein kinase